MKLNEKSWFVIFALFSLIFILLRFWTLTDSCLWFDEIFSIHAAEHSWDSLFRFVAQDLIHPPLFYVLLKIWIWIGGDSLFWLRLFPVFISILALVPFYFLCRELKLNRPAIAVALLFLASSGTALKYAQEVRMYSLLFFFSVVSLWLFTRFLHLGKNIWILTVVNILLIHTHYFGWLVVLAEVAVILILQRIKIRQILIMFGICLASFLPWIFALRQAAQENAGLAQNIGWISRPDLITLFQFIFDLVEPFYYQASSIEAASNYLISIPVLLLIAAAKILFLANYKSYEENEKQRFWMLSIFILLPVVLAFTASWILPFSIWGSRHLIIVYAPTAILLGVFFNAVKPRVLRIIMLSALALLFAAAFILETSRPKQSFIWCAWENFAQKIDTSQTQKIYVFEDLVAYHFWFSLRREENTQVVKIENLEGIAEDTAYFLPRGFDRVKKAEKFEGERFWIAFRDTEWNQSKPPLRNLINEGYQIGEPKVFETQGLKAFLVEVRK